MRYCYRLIILLTLLFSSGTYAAFGIFLDALDWRPTETNDWVYNNSETLPKQSVTYKTIDFNYAPGFRIGITHQGEWDGLLSLTHLYASTNDSAIGHLQPSFLGSVTAKPFPPGTYLYQSGQVRQTIYYNIIDANIGKSFSPAAFVTLQPIVGLMGGWINQRIYAAYQGSTSTREKITNNFEGIGPKIGLNTAIHLFNCYEYEPNVIVGFAASYQFGDWSISDVTTVTPPTTVNVLGANHKMGALTLQGLLGLELKHKKLSVKLAYEINEWFDQFQIFDNDTGAHNNDLVLQGLTVGIAYDF